MTTENVQPTETADQPETPEAAAKRAAFVADLRSLANLLAENTWAPVPRFASLQEHLNTGGSPETIVPSLARMRDIADRLGVELDESMYDRTLATANFGGISYQLVAWHKDGRPAERDEREAELERLRAEIAALRGDRSVPLIGRVQAELLTGARPECECGLPLGHRCECPVVRPDDEPEGRAAEGIPAHYETGGWTGGDGGCGAECACGIGYGGFDTPAEAVTVLDAHIADANGGQPAEEAVHLEVDGAKTMCGLAIIDLETGAGWTNDHGAVTCKACIDKAPF